MGIYISGLWLPKMPDHFEQGEEVPYIDIRIFASGHAVISKGERPYFDEFKAIEVAPHGRLGDLDALRAEFPMPSNWNNANEVLCHITGIWAEIDAAPTIIPADVADKDGAE